MFLAPVLNFLLYLSFYLKYFTLDDQLTNIKKNSASFKTLSLTLIAFNEGNTSITCPVSGGEVSITNGDDTVYDERPALFVAYNG